MAVMENSKKTVYIDLDNTLADYLGMCDQMHISPAEAKHTIGFFKKLRPMPGAVEAYEKLNEHFYLFRTIPVQHSGDTRSLFCE